MSKRILACLVIAAAAVTMSESVSAQQPNSFGFLPFGFYQPYGAQYGSTLRTPPYFATNPPVYYGARHARPYGLSPFASPPMVTAGADYVGRLRTQFHQPQVPTPGPSCNPCVSYSAVITEQVAKGPVRANPFVDSSDKLATN